MKYKCEICKYATDIKCNYDVHMNSKRHLKMTDQANVNTDTVFDCTKCGKKFPYRNNMYRHRKICGTDMELETENVKLKEELVNTKTHMADKIKIAQLEKNIIVLEKDKMAQLEKNHMADKIAQLEKNIIILEKDKEYLIKDKENMAKDKEYLIKDKENRDTLIQTLSNTTIHTTNAIVKTTSAFGFMAAHYVQSMALRDTIVNGDTLLLKGIRSPHTIKMFCSNLLKQFRLHKTAEYIGMKIVERYRKKDPREQSIWSTDASRYIYAIMEFVDDSPNAKWIVDRKGVTTNKLIVKPLLNYICDMLRTYVATLNNKVQRNCRRNPKTAGQLNKSILDDMRDVNDIMVQINGPLSDSIIRVMAPYFHMDKYGNRKDIDIEKCINEFNEITEISEDEEDVINDKDTEIETPKEIKKKHIDIEKFTWERGFEDE